LGWYIRRNTHTLGDCEKATHRSGGGVGYICIFDKVGYDMRTFFVTSQCCFGVFRTRSFSDWLFFDFQILFFFVSRGFLFFLRERESVGLFCLLGTRLVKSVKNFSFFWDVLCTSSLICNPTFSISFQVQSLRPCLCKPPFSPQPIIIIIIDSLKSPLKPL